VCREFLLKWVLPRDARQLNDWLYWLELGSIALSLVFLYFFVHALLTSDNGVFLKDAFFAGFSFLGLSFTVVLQYLLAIEFNTRKKK